MKDFLLRLLIALCFRKKKVAFYELTFRSVSPLRLLLLKCLVVYLYLAFKTLNFEATKLVVGCWLLPRDGNGNGNGMTAAIGNQLCVKRRVASEREREYNFESRR